MITIKKGLLVATFSRSWCYLILSVIVIILANEIEIHSFPLDPAIAGRAMISHQRSCSNPRTSTVASPNTFSKNRIILKANRRDGVSREVFVETLLATIASTMLGLPEVAHAAAAADEVSNAVTTIPYNENEVVKGRITLAPSVDITDEYPNASLYITCRPDKIDSVPGPLLNAYNGKAPPVLSVRIPNPTFPMEFVFQVPNDITLEGAWDKKSSLSSTNAGLLPTPTTSTIVEELWWNKADLIVSARWDSDGVAATRSPDDLVGRGLWKFQEPRQESVVEIQLTGRGAFGKFATGTGKGIKN